MWRILLASLEKGVVAAPAPDALEPPPERFRGMVTHDPGRCDRGGACVEACPSRAVTLDGDPARGPARWEVDHARCVFCGLCEEACPTGAITIGRRYDLAATKDERALVEQAGGELRRRARALFGRSLHVRAVDTGSCNGCEIEIAQLLTPHYDFRRFGIDFVASPRHADALLVTGPVTRALEPALRATYEATPDPKIVIAVGACALSGGIVGDAYGACGGVDRLVPVDVSIPGCPPRPLALLHGLLVAMGRAEARVPSRR